jgi:hypothetical protein
MALSNATAVWERLVGGKSLHGLDLPLWQGRIDMRSFVAPEPKVTGRYAAANADVTELGGLIAIRGRQWKGIDFSGARLASLRFFDSTLEDCVFDGSCDMVNCTFAQTKLSKVDFQGTVFANCTFEGQLDEVLFYRHAFRGERFPANEMKGVDQEGECARGRRYGAP